jgi:acetyl esterase/lipase
MNASERTELKVMIRRLMLSAGFLLLTTGVSQATTDPLTNVNRELREVAAAILHPARGGAPFTPPKPGPLPVGVVERQLAPRDRQPRVTVYVVNGRAGEEGSEPLRGAILYLHGGGFVAGDARQNLRALKALAVRLDCVIVSVQYRLATTAAFPAPMEDSYTALKWLHDDAATLGVDRNRIVVMGESAGGGLAAMLTLAARDRKEVSVAFQALVYPMLDDRTGTSRTVPDHIGRLIWTPASNRIGWRALLGREPGGADAPAGSVPARAANLAGLPPTFIEVGSIDLFAAEDIEFARRLIDVGVPTELLVVPGAFHGFQLMVPNALVSRQFNGALEEALSRALSSGSHP